MHPILFRIPLPHFPLKYWWGLVAVAAITVLYAAFSQKKGDRQGAIGAFLVALAAGVGAYALRDKSVVAENLPIYSYGVMLGLSLVVGWYLTLTLAERDGLPKETMANCYVITAIAAIVGSRVLYVATNLDEFKTFGDVFALRRGGLVAYGGFIGGYLGAWAYLSRHKIRLMPWADVAVPSLASGLAITRIGCYLFGCDFGKRLPETAPAFLKKWGTFPHWTAGTLDAGEGSPAYVRHLELWPDKARALNTSLPVHPTQIYESLVGLVLLLLLLSQRRSQKFRGQIFFLFVFGYGVCRFLLEILRDDVERGEYGPLLPEHVMVPGALFVMALGFIFGIALGIKNAQIRTVARIVSIVPALVAYILLKPASFGTSVNVQLSTSQWIALTTALIVSYYYAKFWGDARKNPKLAMSLGEVQTKPAATSQDDDEEEDEEEAAGDEDEEEARVQDKKKKVDDPKQTIASTPEARRMAKVAAEASKLAKAEKATAGAKKDENDEEDDDDALPEKA
jgi:phosphatidylglycerol:prolipoprotein diacylglycerol transferase